jgi:hypothetical protein
MHVGLCAGPTVGALRRDLGSGDEFLDERPGAVVWLGCEIGGRRETDAVFYMWEKAMHVARVSAAKAARVFVGAEMD